MSLAFRFALLAMFLIGAYALGAVHPHLVARPEAAIGVALLGGFMLALLLDEIRHRPPTPAAMAGPAPSEPAQSAEFNPRRMSFGRRFVYGMKMLTVNLTLWCLVSFGFALAYANRAEIKETALVTLSALKPGEPIALSKVETVLTRDGYGHFTAMAKVNGEAVRMLIDTGSSDVALPYEEALRLGVDVDALRFTRAVMTANGQAMVAPVTLPEITVGAITLHNVAASVAEPGRLGSPLLGMSFLGQLREVSIRGDQLRLKS